MEKVLKLMMSLIESGEINSFEVKRDETSPEKVEIWEDGSKYVGRYLFSTKKEDDLKEELLNAIKETKNVIIRCQLYEDASILRNFERFIMDCTYINDDLFQSGLQVVKQIINTSNNRKPEDLSEIKTKADDILSKWKKIDKLNNLDLKAISISHGVNKFVQIVEGDEYCQANGIESYMAQSRIAGKDEIYLGIYDDIELKIASFFHEIGHTKITQEEYNTHVIVDIERMAWERGFELAKTAHYIYFSDYVHDWAEEQINTYK